MNHVLSPCWQQFREKAARFPQRIIFADGEDSRTLEAASFLLQNKICQPVLIGHRQRIQKSNSAFEIIDFSEFSQTQKDDLIHSLSALPKFQGKSPEVLETTIQDPLFLGCLLLRTHQVDGFIGGATRTTGDTLKAVFSIIGMAKTADVIFGFFMLESRQPERSSDPLVFFADCAVIPNPSAKQLARIAIGASEAYRFFMLQEPKTAFLSFSTNGSATHEMVDKMKEALKITIEKCPQNHWEGEWQADACLDPFSATQKGVGHSKNAGACNVLIAPDLNTGNIAYKLVQRVGNTRAVGPILWGTAQPANDLSRGCLVEDIIDMAAITSLQAISQRNSLS